MVGNWPLTGGRTDCRSHMARPRVIDTSTMPRADHRTSVQRSYAVAGGVQPVEDDRRVRVQCARGVAAAATGDSEYLSDVGCLTSSNASTVATACVVTVGAGDVRAFFHMQQRTSMAARVPCHECAQWRSTVCCAITRSGCAGPLRSARSARCSPSAPASAAPRPNATAPAARRA